MTLTTFIKKVADMRKGFDGLSGLVRNEMGSDPLDGSVYLFVNRRQDRMKMLVWQKWRVYVIL
ncbi:MAG: IS66 family insertion sequence element accessory protein TnpB [Saprospiraceae bacterium]